MLILNTPQILINRPLLYPKTQISHQLFYKLIFIH